MIDWTLPQFCIDCGHELRKSKSAPDRRRPHYAKGRCSSCYYLHKSPNSTRRYDWSKPRYCAGCKKQMRPNSQRSDGTTVKHFSRGVCENCHEKSKRVGNGSKPITSLIYDETGQVCKYCHRHQPFSSFPTANHNPTGRRSKCTSCQRLWDAYRLTYADYADMLANQDGKCAGCSTVTTLYVDHDHACCPTERTCGRCVRGLLCVSCNTGLGKLKDSIKVLSSLIDYLETHQQKVS